MNTSLSAGKKYCVLVTVHGMTHITKEARELTASAAFVQNTVAKAVLVTLIGHRLVVNFYMKVNKPKIKTHMFTDREKAIEWLRSQLKA
jgi:hypothetical protein